MATFSNVRRNNDWRGCPHRVKTTAQSSQKVVEAYFVIEIVHLIWQNHMVSNCHNQSGVSGLIKLTDKAPYFAEYIYEYCLCSDWGLPNILKSNWNFQTYAYFYSSAVSFLGGQQHPQPWASSASGNASLTPLLPYQPPSSRGCQLLWPHSTLYSHPPDTNSSLSGRLGPPWALTVQEEWGN